jgi:hypothetical protein
MTIEERRTYMLEIIRRSAAGSARRIWAQSMLAQIDRPTQAPKIQPTRKEKTR